MQSLVLVSVSSNIIDWLKGTGLFIALVALGAFVLVRIVRLMVHRAESRMVTSDDEPVPSEREKRARAVSGIVSNFSSVVIYAVAFIVILDRLGVRTGSIIASIGVLGIAIGLGAQSLARDFISGVFIIAEGQYGVGDVIKVQAVGGAITGKVERITFRTTRLRGTDGESQIIPNGEIRIVSNLSKEWARAVLDIPVAPDQLDEAQAAVEAAGASLAADPEWRAMLLGEPEMLGVEKLGKDAATLRFSVRTLPLKQWEVSRAMRQRVVDEFARRGIVGSLEDEDDEADE